MVEIIFKYKDNNGYVRELEQLRRELESLVTKDEASSIIKEVYENNLKILKDLDKENRRLESISKLKKKKKELLDYKLDKKEEKVKEDTKQIKVGKEYDDITFYIDFIELNIDNDSYLSVLPSTKNNNDIKLLDRIISYFIKEKNSYKQYLSFDGDDEALELYESYDTVCNKLLDYKENLFIEEEKEEKVLNEVSYYMNGDEPYLYTDIEDYPETYESIEMLLNSLKKGEFKNIKTFNHNDKTKGLLELRDLTHRTRLLFDIVGRKKYCVIGAIVNKTDTNTLYKERLVTRYSKYKSEKDNISYEERSLSKIFRGDGNE